MLVKKYKWFPQIFIENKFRYSFTCEIHLAKTENQ